MNDEEDEAEGKKWEKKPHGKYMTQKRWNWLKREKQRSRGMKVDYGKDFPLTMINPHTGVKMPWQ